MPTKRILSYFLIGTILAAGIFWYFQIYKNTPRQEETKPIQTKKETTKKTVCPLDGLMVSEEIANRHPLGVMIENHIDARPQAGLSDASLVYEALAEGGITRFLAIFVWSEPEKVGPVRSARTYFLDWVSEFNAFYAHAGGSVNALQKIKEYKILDLPHNQIAYWREPKAGTAIEHTLYASPKKLWQWAASKKWDMTGNYESFKFKDDAPPNLRPANASLTINYSTQNYQVTWIYDPTTNFYIRNQIKGPLVKAKNIIVQYVNRKMVISGGKRVWDFTTIGTGKAKVFMDGKIIEGTWKKESRKSRTRFYDSTGSEIKFNRGKTWIEIIHPEISITFK